VLENKQQKISDIEIMSEAEKKQVLFDFNDTEAGYPKDKTIHQLFAEQAAQTPDYIALHGCMIAWMDDCMGAWMHGMHLSYRELNEQSDHLAGLLIEKGVLADNIVGLMMSRSVEMIIGILGILKAGGAYMPIDPEYPQERIDYMLKDSNARILINKSEIRNSKSESPRRGHPIKNIDDQNTNDQNKNQHSAVVFVLNFENLNFEFVSDFVLRASDLNSSNPAYVIYTSGTTGRPKGTLITHRNVVRLLFNDKFQFDFSNRDVWTLFHSFCFDFSVWEMYGALLYGGKLIIVPKLVTRDTIEFLKLLNKEAVTVLNQTPSAFYNLINEVCRQKNNLYLRYIIFGGEALNPSKLKTWQEEYPQIKLINMFGITETTVHVTFKELSAHDVSLNVSNIGKPIPTLKIYILDMFLKPVPVGVIGELYVGGDGVARGYLNRPELTAERFIDFHHSSFIIHHSKLYCTGDLARWLPAGHPAGGASGGGIEYLGRIDSQVKIRGFRIELGEIENCLLKHNGVKEAVVLAKEDKDKNKYLIAYLVADPGLSITQLREFLAAQLPAHMIPAFFSKIPRIPLTANGKIARDELPGPGEMNLNEEMYIGPGDKIEAELCEVWQEVLGLERIGVNDSFFKTGGDSIKAIRLISTINQRLHTDIKIVDLFTHNCIRELGQIIKNKAGILHDKEREQAGKEIAELKERIITSGRMPGNAEDVFPMSDIEKGMIFHTFKNPGAAIYHDQLVYYQKYLSFNALLFKRALELMMEKHPALRVSYNIDEFNECLHFINKPFPVVYKHFDTRELAE
ncbi:MAG: amino acid adenylation domain-containing protein, partial [Acidobacteria bacterium]|nr:amino acid adenylation domain-containing protein [Acidobacteriota bacterium]